MVHLLGGNDANAGVCEVTAPTDHLRVSLLLGLLLSSPPGLHRR